MKILHMSREEMVQDIIDDCELLKAGESMTHLNFGRNRNLVLHILRDSDYNPETGEYDIVSIVTKKDGKAVDDTEDIHIDDLYDELSRIYDEKDFSTL